MTETDTELVAVLPAASLAVALTAWVPAVAFRAFQVPAALEVPEDTSLPST